MNNRNQEMSDMIISGAISNKDIKPQNLFLIPWHRSLIIYSVVRNFTPSKNTKYNELGNSSHLLIVDVFQQFQNNGCRSI